MKRFEGIINQLSTQRDRRVKRFEGIINQLSTLVVQTIEKQNVFHLLNGTPVRYLTLERP